ncbi:Eco57I restriction-modification methylase domain-containing protein [Thermoflexus sp.]|uniref:Eco57I restriction-modification methylase domain-containing protein n=1 Tax=Thermoflexus sp. TaxID=1969742 RepID=UPI0035E4186A
MRTVTVEPAVVLRPSLKGRAVHLEGGLFGPDFLERLERGDLPGQRPADFGIRPGRSVVEEAAEAYRDAQDLWRVFRRRLERLPEDDPATSLTREGWMIPLLGLLGYEPRYNPKAYDVDGVSYAISHRAGEPEDAPPVHIVGARRELGRVDPSGRPRLSPHALLQEFLNRSEHLWGIVTNGRVLRLLRKSTFLRRPAYVEFDLEMIFEAEGGERFGDFLLLYRLLHRSRLPRGIGDAPSCLLERYYQEALEQGNRARDRMRDGVEECLKILGTGFLRANPGWRADPAQLYTDLLRLVYRFLFLLVAEERGLLGGNDLYREHYSVSRLRRLVDRLEAYTEHDDLWQSLRVLWHLLRDPRPQADGRPLASLLGLPVLDGGLFEPIPLEGLTISNRDLLCAFYYLTYYYDEEAHTDRWVNYAALDVEELGSVYESLLDNHPVIEDTPDGPVFTFTEGTERKSTGSYYTPPELVQELIRSALEPVLEEKLRQAKDPKAKAQAILSIKVLDPATGSGHFLLAAARRLGKELARVRTGEEEPSPEALREATREVIAHCVYGVDKNPLAVELCKVALWIESQVPGKPLTFLDHRIRVGDSLVGVLDLAALKEGIPDAAYEPAQGDDREVARALKRRNAEERAGQMSFFGAHLGDPRDALRQSAQEALEVEAIPDDTLEEIARKARRHQALQRSLDPLRQAADLWTAAFFQEKKRGKPAITTDAVRRSLAGQPVHGQVAGLAEALAQEHRFFHWPLEFPEVFAQGGFDVVLGNPPWERIKLQEQEFFAARDPEIANTPNAAERKRRIAQLPKKNPELWREYQKALHTAESTSRFLRGSGFYPLTGRGDINTYSVFAERMRALLKPGGRMGIIVPTGIATDDTNKHFFAEVVGREELLTLYGFDNRKKLFPAIGTMITFCLLTLRKADDRSRPAPRPGFTVEFAFFLHEARDLSDPERRFTLTPEDFRLLNPNTQTTPIFRTRKDAELTKHIYRRVPVLINESHGEARNPWGVKFLRMFDMTNDSHLFRTRKELEAKGFRLQGNVFVKGRERYLPLYEAKMMHQFDHRFGDYAMKPSGSESTQLPEVPLERLSDPRYQVLPRYWVPEEEVEERLRAKDWDRGWLLGWRDIARSTDERTVIAAIIPRVGVGNKIPLIVSRRPSLHHPLLVAVLCSLPLDYAARQKVGGTTLNFFIFEQLPVLPPSAFEQPLPFPWEPAPSPLPSRSRPPTVADFVRPRVLELTYTAWDLKPFAEDLGYRGPPFRYDPERRFWLRAELDALFFHLYLGTPEEWEEEASPELKALFPTPQEAVAYILDQFPIVRHKDEERFGEYRTQRVILEIYDAMAEAARTGRPWRSRLAERRVKP